MADQELYASPLVECVAMYSVRCYYLFEEIGVEKSKKLVLAANEISSGYPLHLVDLSMQWELPYYGKATGGQVIAIISTFIVWSLIKSQKDQTEKPELQDSPFLEAAYLGWLLFCNKQSRLSEEDAQDDYM